MHNNIFFLSKIKTRQNNNKATTGDVVNMQFTRGLVSSYLLNWLKGKQSSKCMVISLDSTKVLFSINAFHKVSINVM